MADLCSCFFYVYYPTACNFICYFLHAIGGRQAGPGWRQLRKQRSRGRKKPWVLSWVPRNLSKPINLRRLAFFLPLGVKFWWQMRRNELARLEFEVVRHTSIVEETELRPGTSRYNYETSRKRDLLSMWFSQKIKSILGYNSGQKGFWSDSTYAMSTCTVHPCRTFQTLNSMSRWSGSARG